MVWINVYVKSKFILKNMKIKKLTKLVATRPSQEDSIYFLNLLLRSFTGINP